MHIVVTGSTGFLGKPLCAALLARGHTLVCPVRSPPSCPPDSRVQYVILDYLQADSPSDWQHLVVGADVIVNAVGIIRETRAQTFDAIHRDAPVALFQAAQEQGVGHIVQISALGADAQAQTPYHRSKKEADDVLRASGRRYTVVQPALIFGMGGESAALFTLFASLPLIAVPGRGTQEVQPVHLDDVIDALVAIVERRDPASLELALVGPQPLTLTAFYEALRAGMGIETKAPVISVPMPLMRALAWLGSRLPHSLLDSDTLSMLNRGNTASPDAIGRLLGRPPRPVREFIPARYASAVAAQARLRWLLPLLRWSIAIVWIVTGIISMGIYPLASSYELLTRSGVPDALLPLALFGAAALDIAFGVSALLPRRARWIWAAQASIVLLYTAIISWRLPEFWLHPYGPITKNLPFLAALWLLYEFEGKAWNTS